MRYVILAVFVIVSIAGLNFARAGANEQPGHPLPSPTPVPSGPLSIQNLGKFLNNQGVQIWALQNQVKALQNALAAQQKAIASQQQTIAALQSDLQKFQAAYAKHTHLYENAGTAVYVDTIPQMYCTHTGPGGSCWSNGTLTILGYKGTAKMTPTSGPQ